MIDSKSIKPHMPVVCSKGRRFGVIDHLEGHDRLKLAPGDMVARGIPHAGEEDNPTGTERVRSQQKADPELYPERAERLERQ